MKASSDDVWGAIIADELAGAHAVEIIERDDGWVTEYRAPYLLPFDEWDEIERQAMAFVRGRVLDVGCGGGRVCLYLQSLGFSVFGIDSSAAAIACCRRRGVRDCLELDINDVDASLGSFETIVFVGQTLGILGSRERARSILTRLAHVVASPGRIVATSFDSRALNDPVEERYRERNRQRGRMPGQQRLRVRYGSLATPWLDWLQLSPRELSDLLVGTGWRLSRTLGHGPTYVAVIDRA